MKGDAYEVRLETFEGPMELLMHLIQVNRIDIHDIPIASLTKQYMAYIDDMRSFDMEVASEFLVMAATLLLIKSRVMLPQPPKEEAGAQQDPRDEIVNRLLEYRRFKKIGAELSRMAEYETRYVSRPPEELPIKLLPPKVIPIGKLWEAFASVVAVRRELTVPEVIVAEDEYRVEEQMVKVMNELTSRGDGAVSLGELFTSGTRSELIATFLAVLELVRRKMAVARQGGLFSPIMVSVRKKEA